MIDGERLLDVNGTRQWVGVWGASRETAPLLVLHGGPGAQNLLYGRSVGERLARRRTLVLHEQRGCGRSPATGQTDYTLAELTDDVIAVIEQLGSPVDLLGWSFGGDLAAHVVLARPDLVRRLVLQAPAIDFQADVVSDYLLRQLVEIASDEFRPRAEAAFAIKGTNWDRLLAGFETMDAETSDRQQFLQPGKAEWAREQWRTAPAGFIPNNMAMLESLTLGPPEDPIWDRLPEIDKPTLVLTGEHDHNVDPARTRRVAEQIPGARLVTFADSAHQPDVDVPEEYVAAVVEFLEG